MYRVSTGVGLLVEQITFFVNSCAGYMIKRIKYLCILYLYIKHQANLIYLTLCYVKPYCIICSGGSSLLSTLLSTTIGKYITLFVLL